MLIRRIERLYNGYADIRDYTVKEAIRKKINIRLDLDDSDRTMTLTPNDLKEKKVIINKEPIVSKHYPDQEYRLYSYRWEDDRKLTKEEELEEFAKKYL